MNHFLIVSIRIITNNSNWDHLQQNPDFLLPFPKCLNAYNKGGDKGGFSLTIFQNCHQNQKQHSKSSSNLMKTFSKETSTSPLTVQLK